MMLRRMMMAANAAPVESAPLWANVVSLLHFDGEHGTTNFTDEKGVSWNKNAVATHDTDTKKFGSSSLRLLGPLHSNLSAMPSSPVNPGFDLIGSSFTVEMWCRIDALQFQGTRLFATGGGLLGWNATNGIHVLFQVSETGVLELQMSKGVAGVAQGIGTIPVPLGQFAFLTCSFDHMEQRGYLGVNGLVEQLPVFTDIAKPAESPGMAIGKSYNTWSSEEDASCLLGWVDEFRLTKGEAFRKASFTPPSAPFPAAT